MTQKWVLTQFQSWVQPGERAPPHGHAHGAREASPPDARAGADSTGSASGIVSRLFAGAVPKSTGKSRSVRFDLKLAPDASGKFVQIADIKPREKYQLKIVGADGKILRDVKMRGGDPVPVSDLPKGGYSVWVKRKKSDWQIGRVVSKA